MSVFWCVGHIIAPPVTVDYPTAATCTLALLLEMVLVLYPVACASGGYGKIEG